MRAYVIKEQTSLADLMGVSRTASSPTTSARPRNNEPIANTEGARQIGSKFTRQEWETIFLFSTRTLTSRQTTAEQTERFRRFYARFGPSSPLRTPQEYGAALTNFRVPFTITTFSWNNILSNLQNVLRQGQQWRASQESGDSSQSLSDDAILELAQALQRATSGANYNEGEIVFNLRRLRNQNDYNRLLQVYSSLDTVGRNLEEVLNQLNDEEKQTIAKIFADRSIQPGEIFDSGEEEIPTQFDVYNLGISEEDFPNNEAYDVETSERYRDLVLNTILERLGTNSGQPGLQFYNFINFSEARDVVEFNQAMANLADDGKTRRQLNISIAGLLRLIWPLFNTAQSQAEQ